MLLLPFYLLLLSCKCASCSKLSSIIFLHSSILLPEKQLPILVNIDKKIKVPEGLFLTNTSEGFLCSQAAHNRALIWNSGTFRDYLESVHSLSTFHTFVEDFLARIANGMLKKVEPVLMSCILKDAILLALVMEQSGLMSIEDRCSMMGRVVRMLIQVIKQSTPMPGVPIPHFLSTIQNPPSTSIMPFKGTANPLGIINATRMARLAEESHLWNQYDTTEIVQFAIQNYNKLQRIKSYNSSRTILDTWIKGTYLSKRMTTLKGQTYLTTKPSGVGFILPQLLQRIKSYRCIFLYVSLLTIDQISFQLDYVSKGQSSEESILLLYLKQTGDANGILGYAGELLECWKELHKVGLVNIMAHQEDFERLPFTKIRLFRIHYLLQRENNQNELMVLDKIEAFLKK